MSIDLKILRRKMQMQRYLKETENYDKMIKRKIGGRKFSRKIIPKLCEAFAVANKNPDTSKFFSNNTYVLFKKRSRK